MNNSMFGTNAANTVWQPALALCTKNKKGRLLERSEYQPYMEQNKKNIETTNNTYKKWQAIVEHT